MPPERESNEIGRKSSKPLMEKRRRARINDSLMQLKCLVLEATNKNTSRHSKLEKADILEMTVKYLKGVYRSQAEGISNEFTPSSIASQYRCGFNECISQVSRFFAEIDDPGFEMRSRLMNHLVTAGSSATAPPAKRHHRPTTKSAPYPPVQIHFQTRETHPQMRETLQSACASPGSHPPTVMDVISHPIETQVTTAPQHVAAMTTSVARIVSGIPIGFTGSITPGEVTLVLPQHAFPSAGLQTQLIPVYANSIAPHFTSVRVPSSACSVMPISELGNKVVAASVSSLPETLLVTTNFTADSSALSHNSVQRSSSSGENSDVKSETDHSVHESAERQQVENANDDFDPMWRPW